MKVHALMSLNYLALAKQARLYEALELMADSRKSCVVICEDQIPVGIVTERDLVKVYRKQIVQQQFEDLPLSSIMTHNPVCTSETSDLYEALSLARKHHIRHIPVIDDNKNLVGLLTQTDTLEAYLAAWEKTAELKAANEHLKLLSLEDSLLGIGNRRSLNIDLSHIEASSERNEQAFSVAMIDVDNFKKYNDHYGHQAGDKALITIVAAIKASMRESDRVYRYGGEEIILLMPNTHIDEAFTAADRIRQAIEQLDIAHCKVPSGQVTVSIGVACSKNLNWKKTIKAADAALYQAKREGKNQTQVAQAQSIEQLLG